MINSVTREVCNTDAIAWLSNVESNRLPEKSGVFTSIPDIGELVDLFGGGPNANIDGYLKWFEDTVILILSKLNFGSFSLFLQSDIKIFDNQNNLVRWIDKSFLCSHAASKCGCSLVWHKIARLPNSAFKHSKGRSSFSHFLCFRKDHSHQKILQSSNVLRIDNDDDCCDSDDEDIFDRRDSSKTTEEPVFPATPDIFFRGDMVWPKAIGLNCAVLGVSFLKTVGCVDLVIDPFCGHGTILAVANVMGMNSLGIELSEKRCKIAESLDLTERLAKFPNELKDSLGMV